MSIGRLRDVAPDAEVTQKLMPLAVARAPDGRASQALSRKLAASQAIAVPGFVAPTTSPPSAAPPMKLLFRPRRSSAFALCSIDLGTVCGTIPVEAGQVNVGGAEQMIVGGELLYSYAPISIVPPTIRGKPR